MDAHPPPGDNDATQTHVIALNRKINSRARTHRVSVLFSNRGLGTRSREPKALGRQEGKSMVLGVIRRAADTP